MKFENKSQVVDIINRPPTNSPDGYFFINNKDTTPRHTHEPYIVDISHQTGGEQKSGVRDGENNSACAAVANKCIFDAALDTQFVDEIITQHLCDGDRTAEKYSYYCFNWKSTKNWINAAGIPLQRWGDCTDVLYTTAINRQMSPESVKKCIILLNHYINFCASRGVCQRFRLPTPSGKWRRRISDAFNASGNTKEATPLTPALLRQRRERLKKEHYRFFYVGLWLGLRPSEIESATENPAECLKVEKLEGVTVLCIYQKKLVALCEGKRWKQIPILLREQRVALRFLLGGACKAPSGYFIKKAFYPEEKRMGLYSGRKGFAPLMMSRGLFPDEVFRMLGHQNVQMMVRHYTDNESLQRAYARKTIERYTNISYADNLQK